MENPSTQYQCAPDVLFQEVNGEIVLLDLNKETYFGLNESGARVWQLLQEGLNAGQIIERLESEFEVEHEQVRADVLELLDQLKASSLINPVA